ncbi:MAG TPA: glycosyl hydrolase family 65 protein [bacterium]|nr:glycosyl hydrolase family 65 protein [bacterium]
MNEWTITYDEYQPELQPLREALCTLGNGYFASRGAAEEVTDDGVHYPGTYLAGGYNRLSSQIAGKDVENEDLVNWPNWLYLTFRPEDGDWSHPDTLEFLEYHIELRMQQGILFRRIHFKDRDGRETRLESRRIVHMAYPHLAAIQWNLTPVNWSGQIEIRSGLDGRVTNNGVERYRDLRGDHLEILDASDHSEESIYLRVQTKQSRIQMTQAARTRVYTENPDVRVRRSSINQENFIAQDLMVDGTENQTIRIEKMVALYTSRDNAISEPTMDACKAIDRAGSFDELLEGHIKAWDYHWRRCDIELSSNQGVQDILRLHIFHLLQTASTNTIDLDVGIPARGLHGEAYRGHIFWDELFIFPFLDLRIPEVTREVKMYRYRRIGEARYAASKAGYRGAMFPWQSGSDGREESQQLHLNPKSGEWIPDETHLQRHVNLAIAYNVWQFYQTTNDIEFLSFFGAEMVLDIAKFLTSLVTYNEQRGRYEIQHVVGPDEYHTRYPDSDKLGINNNAYTNIMTVWVLQRALEILKILDEDREQELCEILNISDEDRHLWEEISSRMFVPFHGDGIISQFEGYDDLEEFDWEGYREKYDDIQRLDRILDAEGDTPNRYKASKQADVVMLFFLYSAEELQLTLELMDYDFSPSSILKNIDYYLERTSHGSTLSRIVHSWVLARSNREQSWDYFEEALRSDFEDIQGGTTPEGIHLGAMAGTVDLIQRCYTGLEFRNDVLWLNPALPEELESLRLRIRYRAHWISLHVTHDRLLISFFKGYSPEVQIGVQDKIYTFKQGDSKEFKL